MRAQNLNLCKGEITLYFAVYIFYIVYELFKLSEARYQIWKISTYAFPRGWPILNSFKDDTNDELYAFTEYVNIYWPWYVFHLAATIINQKYIRKSRSLINGIVGVLILATSMKLVSITLIGCLVMSYYITARKQSKLLTWTISALWMTSMIFLKSNRVLQEKLGYIEFHNLMVTLCWSILRGCSFSLQYEKDKTKFAENLNTKYCLKTYLGYTLYFPCLMLGPFMGYNRYFVSEQTDNPATIRNIKTFLWQICKVIFWWIMLEIGTHFVYVHYMAVDIAAVEVLNTKFGLYAVGYFMGQFFFMFYIITYGLGIAFAQFDGLNPPRKPRCIGLVHSYSDMWKYFDEGLYEFLFFHIYAEICNKSSSALRKILAIALTFLFVFLWHGYYEYVFIWSILNFFCLLAEKSINALINSSTYIHFMKKQLRFSESGLQRFNAFLGSQIFIPAAFSNCYFISGVDVGNYLMKGVYFGGWWNYLTLTFCTYCFFQCCEILLKKKIVN